MRGNRGEIVDKTKDGALSGHSFIQARIDHDERLLSYFTGDTDPSHEGSNRAIIARLRQRIDKLRGRLG